MTRRRPLPAALAAVLLGAAVGCQSDGNFTLLGYTTKPPFDPDIRSVYIPAFKITPFHTSPNRELEVDVTQAVIDELNRRRSPIRVVSDPARADTELVGTITAVNKGLQNRNLLNLPREFDVIIAAELVWRDLRTGRVLTGSREPAAPPLPERPFDPSLPPPAPPPPTPETSTTRVSVTAYGRVIPELGETNATGIKRATEELARNIVNMMEKPW